MDYLSPPNRGTPSAAHHLRRNWERESMKRREPDPQHLRSTIKDAVNWAFLPWDTRCIIHPKFFLNDGTLMLRVEDSLYQVHRHTFEHESPFFRTVFASLKLSDSTSLLEGSSPIAAACIQGSHELTLTPTRPRTRTRTASGTITGSTTSPRRRNGRTVLSLSYKLVLDKAVLGKRFGIKSWVATSYRELCERRKPPTVEEGRRLGLEIVIRIYQFKHDMAEGYGYSYEVEKVF